MQRAKSDGKLAASMLLLYGLQGERGGCGNAGESRKNDAMAYQKPRRELWNARMGTQGQEVSSLLSIAPP